MLELKNFEINKNIQLGEGTINGQGCGPVSRMRYGLCPMSFNGCEMIALYNMLLLKGMDNPGLAAIAKEMYPGSHVLMGIFGSNPYGIHTYFEKRGILIYRFDTRDRFFEALENGKVGVISFWNADTPFKGIHTVCVERIQDGYRIYNRSNKKEVPVDYKTVDEVVSKQRYICGYCLEK